VSLGNGTGGMSDTGSFNADLRSFNRVLPEGQEIIWADPEMSAREALTMMEEHGFSQLPVRSTNGRLIGAFTYRSFARAVARSERENDIASLPVTEFVEQLKCVVTSQPFDELLDELDERDAVFVGTAERLLGVATPMDVLRYLYDVANAYVLLQEIEMALRDLIRSSITDEQLAECAATSLSAAYLKEPIPRTLEDMSFADYKTILARGDTWGLFEGVFGAGTRKRVGSRLNTVNVLRNDAFHFRRKLGIEDHEELRGVRDWLLMLMDLRPASPPKPNGCRDPDD
jgi:CBS domain-containing protein